MAGSIRSRPFPMKLKKAESDTPFGQLRLDPPG